MDLLADYASDPDSDGPDRAAVPAVAARCNNAGSHSPGVPSVKRARLEAAVPALVQQQAAEPSVSLPDPMALLFSTGPSVGYSRPAAQAVVSAAGVNGTATGPMQQASAARATTAPAVHVQQVNGAAGSRNSRVEEPQRIRNFPHVEGNFPAVVYAAVTEDCLHPLQQLAHTLIAQCPRVPAKTFVAPTATPRAAATESTTESSNIGSATSDAPSCSDRRSNINDSTVVDPGMLRLWPVYSQPSQPVPHVSKLAAPTSAGCLPSCSSAASGVQQQQQAQDKQPEQLPLHMSLSRTVAVKHIQIASLKAALIKQLKPYKPQKVELQGLICLVNDAGTRTFVCIKAANGSSQVVKMIGGVDRAFITHGLASFYQDPLPHVSVAWTPGDQRHLLQPWLDAFQHKCLSMQVSRVVYRVARTEHVVWEA